MNILNLILFTDIEPALLAALIGLIVLLCIIGPAILVARSKSARLRESMIERHRAKLQDDLRRRGRNSRIGEPLRLIDRLVALAIFLPHRTRADKRKLLRSAGFIDDRAVAVFWLFKSFFIIVGIALFLIWCFVPNFFLFDSRLFLLMGMIVAIGYFAPDFFVKERRKARLQRIERGLPDGLDLLVICAEAGLSLDSALKRVADEFVAMTPELSEELLLTSIELNFLPDRRQALLNLAHRVDVPAIRGVTATLVQTEKYGTPLAQALRTLASEFRENRLLRAEDKAARLPAILTVPMIAFILPALFIVLAAPAFIKVAEKMSN
jgi:tight adherence protein C